MRILLQDHTRLSSGSRWITLYFYLISETPLRLSSALLVNRDPLDFGGEVTHFFVLPTSHSLASALGTITLHTDEFGERKSFLTLWDITKSTTALHATFSQLSSVSAPKDEAVRPCASALTIVFYFAETTLRVARNCSVCGHSYLR
jgi:hypothetical protein